jgi:hypothetical protein
MDEEMRENSESDLSKVPKNLQPHVFKKGQIANPLGRKKGSVSLKQYAKQMLESMTYEERMEYLEGLPKDFIWQMAEGKPDAKTTLDAKIEHTLPPEVKEAMDKALEEVI